MSTGKSIAGGGVEAKKQQEYEITAWARAAAPVVGVLMAMETALAVGARRCGIEHTATDLRRILP